MTTEAEMLKYYEGYKDYFGRVIEIADGKWKGMSPTERASACVTAFAFLFIAQLIPKAAIPQMRDQLFLAMQTAEDVPVFHSMTETLHRFASELADG